MNNPSQLTDNDFLQMLRCGYQSLLEDAEEINLLNVFPVPDGDTGTNMRVTLEGGLAAIEGKSGFSKIIPAFEKGTLFGARGNSGVILSEYCKGFVEALKEKEVLCVKDFVMAMVNGYKQAYESTVSPQEGTMLTVARESAEAMVAILSKLTTFEDLFLHLIPAMSQSVENTPNLLFVLKEAGVVDSGGKGLLSIFEGFAEFVVGKRSVEALSFSTTKHTSTDIDYSSFTENSTMEYGYCTEFLLQLLNAKYDVERFDVDEFTKEMGKYGDSLIVTQTGSIVKVHIHTKKPYEPMAYALSFGDFLTMKMDNMSLQHNSVEKKKKGQSSEIIVIARGEGMKETLASLGKVRVIDGGDTMNASVGEILSELEDNAASEVILMPNNKNLLLSAKAAIEEYKDGKVYLVPTSSIQECYLALSMVLLPGVKLDVLAKQMEEFVPSIHSASVARSNRDFNINGVSSAKEEFVETIDGQIVGSSASRVDAFMALLSKVEGIEDKEVMFAFYGSTVDENETNVIKEKVAELYPFLELGFLDGGQNIYDYLVGYVE